VTGSLLLAFTFFAAGVVSGPLAYRSGLGSALEALGNPAFAEKSRALMREWEKQLRGRFHAQIPSNDA
jgi:hypothetical protein